MTNHLCARTCPGFNTGSPTSRDTPHPGQTRMVGTCCSPGATAALFSLARRNSGPWKNGQSGTRCTVCRCHYPWVAVAPILPDSLLWEIGTGVPSPWPRVLLCKLEKGALPLRRYRPGPICRPERGGWAEFQVCLLLWLVSLYSEQAAQLYTETLRI